MTIIVDDRECRSPVVGCLERMPDVEVVVRRLPVGDYQVDEAVVVERKTLADLAASIVDGRLFRQAGRLSRTAMRPALILEAMPSAVERSGISREALQGTLASISIVFGIAVLRAGTPEETARLLRYTAQQIGRCSSGAVKRCGWRRPSQKRRLQLYILQGLPGVGPARAERLLDTFGSVEAVISAECEELTEVHGMGSVTAQAIRSAVGP